MTEYRKTGHIQLTQSAQTPKELVDSRFNYEPLFSKHPTDFNVLKTQFLDKNLGAPLWISSMTGGTGAAKHINQNLATVCAQFKLGMGLGSCRPLLENEQYFDDFNLRPIIGNDLPFYANIGIAQIEELIINKNVQKLNALVGKLQADGLIIHLNPLQEWFQPEGDRYSRPAIETIEQILEIVPYKIIVKEVGQGIGPKSLAALMKLPLAAIEFAAFGGTNFSKLEALRHEDNLICQHDGLTLVGHTAQEMVDIANEIQGKHADKKLCREFIISGGIHNYLDGFYLCKKLKGNSVFGQASAMLKHANTGHKELANYIEETLRGLAMAHNFLELK